MEIFGFPVILIVVFVIAILVDNAEKQKKQKEEVAKKWDLIANGMSREEVTKRLGNPHRAWQAGTAEIWGYGPTDSDGEIKFINGKVIAYQKPG